MNQILDGNCLEVMRGLADQSVGMVFADLPYGITACHWDKVIDLQAMWVELKRLIQPKRALVFTATQPFTTDLICSNRDWFKYCWVWDKEFAGNFIRASKQPMMVSEDVVVFGQGELTYTPQKTPRSVPIKGGGMSASSNFGNGSFKALKKVYTDKFPENIISFKRGLGTAIHPTQKPVALVEYLIRTYTNPGDVVLDPTAGSMTTAIAALNTGRGYICIEKDPDEYRKGLARVEQHLAKPQQFNLLEPTPTLPKQATQTSIFDIGGHNDPPPA